MSISAARLWIVLVAIAAHSSGIAGVFIYDDEGAILSNPTIRSLWTSLNPPAEQVAVHGRPVTNFSLAINYAISGDRPWSYHVLNLLAHGLAALVLFEIVRLTLNDLGVALVIALLWAVHPLTTEAVTYVIQRTEVLAGLFSLTTLYGVLRGHHRLAVMACALAMGSKESAAFVPLIVLLYDRLFLTPSWREILRTRWKLYAGLMATWSIVLLPLAQGSIRGELYRDVQTTIEYALAQCQVIPYYLRLACWPSPLVVDYGVLQPITHHIVPYVLLMTALVGGTGLLLYYRPKFGFLPVCFFAILAPSSSVVPVFTEVAAERRMYLPLAAVITAVVLLVRRMPYARAGAVGVIGLCCLLTFQRNCDYHSHIGIWSDAVVKLPKNPRAWNNLGVSLGRAGRFHEAGRACFHATQLDPHYADAHHNLGLAWAYLGEHQKAEICRQRAVQLRAAHAHSLLRSGGARTRPADARAGD